MGGMAEKLLGERLDWRSTTVVYIIKHIFIVLCYRFNLLKQVYLNIV